MHGKNMINKNYIFKIRTQQYYNLENFRDNK